MSPISDLETLIKLATQVSEPRVVQFYKEYAGSLEDLLQRRSRVVSGRLLQHLKIGPSAAGGLLEGIALGIQIQKAEQGENLLTGIQGIADSMKVYLKEVITEHKAHIKQTGEFANQVRAASEGLASVVQQAEKFSLATSQRTSLPPPPVPAPTITYPSASKKKQTPFPSPVQDTSDTSSSEEAKLTPVEALKQDGTYTPVHKSPDTCLF